MMKALFTVYDLQNGGYYFEEINKLYEEQVYYNDNTELPYRVFMMLSTNVSLLQNVSITLQGKYTNSRFKEAYKLLLRCIDDIKYRLISEQGRKIRIQHQIYYTFDGEFSESNKLILTSESLDANITHMDQIVEIDKKYKALRFDPVENEKCILRNLLIESNQGKIDFQIINGVYDNNKIVLFEEDPQIYIDLENCGEIKWLHICAEILVAELAIKNLIMEYTQKQHEIQVIKQEKEQWEEQSKYWEARCVKMEQTVSWRITGILRKLGSLLKNNYCNRGK